MEEEKRYWILLDNKEINALESFVSMFYEANSDEDIKMAGMALASVVDYILMTKKEGGNNE